MTRLTSNDKSTNIAHVADANNEHVWDVNCAHVSDPNSSDVPESAKVLFFGIHRVPVGPFGPISGQ